MPPGKFCGVGGGETSTDEENASVRGRVAPTIGLNRNVATRVAGAPAAANATLTPCGAAVALAASRTAAVIENTGVATVTGPSSVVSELMPINCSGVPFDASSRRFVKRKVRVPSAPGGSTGTFDHVIVFAAVPVPTAP